MAGIGRERVGLAGELAGSGWCAEKRKKGREKFCSPRKEASKAISDGSSSGGALTADEVGAPGGIEEVNLWQDKLRERRMQHQRGRKGEKKGPSPATSSSSGGGDRGGNAGCIWCSNV
jgi:hypothetical protein